MKFAWGNLQFYIQFKHKQTASKQTLTICRIIQHPLPVDGQAPARPRTWASGTSEGCKDDKCRRARLDTAVRRATKGLHKELRGLVLQTHFSRHAQ